MRFMAWTSSTPNFRHTVDGLRRGSVAAVALSGHDSDSPLMFCTRESGRCRYQIRYAHRVYL